MRGIAFVALVLLLGASPVIGAQAGCRTEARVDKNNTPYQVEVCEGAGATDKPGSTKSSRSGRRYAPSELIRVVSTVDGQQCTIWATRTSGQGQRAGAARHDFAVVGDVFDTSVWDVWQEMVTAMPACGRGRHADPAEQTVFAFLYQYDTPDPDPWVAPGFAITGKRAYLETRGPLTHQPPPTETELGRLEITFDATTLTVDWGDGSPAEEHASPGAPWPDGAAGHVYTDVGTYDIIVAQRWQARWTLGDRAGEVILTGPPSVIEDFDVGQLQAVRDR